MQKRVLALAAVLLLLILAFAWRARPVEPSYLGKTITVWISELATNVTKKPNFEPTRDPALRAIFEIGPDAIPYLRRTLREGSLPSQKALDRLRASLPEKLTARLPTLPGQNAWALKTAAAHSLASFGAAAQEAVPELIDCLESSSSRSAEAGLAANIASYAVFQIGPRPEHLPHAQRLLGSTNQSTWGHAINCIQQMGRKDPEAVEILIKAISLNPTGTFGTIVSMNAMHALADMRITNSQVQTLLESGVTSPNPVIKTSATLALRKITGPTESSNELLQEILEQVKSARPASSPFFSVDGPDYKILSIAKTLTEEKSPPEILLFRFRDLSPGTIHAKLAIAQLLWKHAGETNRLQEVWHEGLNNGDHNIRRQTAIQMNEICSSNRFAPPALEWMLKHEDLALRVFAAAILSKVNGETERTIPILIEGLNDHFTYYDNAKIRETSAISLGEMGNKAAAAKDSLTKLLHDSDDRVRTAARSALRKLKELPQTPSWTNFFQKVDH